MDNNETDFRDQLRRPGPGTKLALYGPGNRFGAGVRALQLRPRARTTGIYIFYSAPWTDYDRRVHALLVDRMIALARERAGLLSRLRRWLFRS